VLETSIFKALTVYDPWASLIALGEKKIETSWLSGNHKAGTREFVLRRGEHE
jgi:hypothetical protein